jgi:1-acyl-sn-glycerol-3-phosphate acyltransferase
MNWLLSLVFWTFLGLSSLLLFPIALLLYLITVPFDPRRAVLHRFTSGWASLYTWLNPAWPVRISGRERLHQAGPTVIVANHLSLLDILVMFRLHTPFKWVSKQENFRVPLIGWNMRLCGYIPLRRGEASSIAAMMRACDASLARGSSIVMFPEGTRSAPGRLRPFKTGAFEIAHRNRVPIQPLVIRGTGEALPKRGFVLQGRHPISIEILEPIPVSEVVAVDPEEMTKRVQDRIAAHLEESPGVSHA